jgi:hypothetical protein
MSKRPVSNFLYFRYKLMETGSLVLKKKIVSAS